MVQIMVERQTDAHPLSEPVMSQLTDEHVRHSAPLCYQNEA